MAISALGPALNLSDYSRTAAQRGWGAGWPSCGGARNNLATITFARSGVRVTVHKRIARLVKILADTTEARGYLAKPGQTGAYNCRAIGGTNSPSNHSWGLAIDWNWQDNPFTTDPSKNHMPGWMPNLWARYGFAWGGWYSGKRDYMHLEGMFTPEQADQLTALAIAELTDDGDDMAQVPQAEWNELNRKVNVLFDALLGKRKPWYGGISNIAVNSQAEMDHAESYDALQMVWRNNVNSNQALVTDAGVRQELADLNARLSALIQIQGAKEGA